MTTDIAERKDTFDLSPRSLDEAMRAADYLAQSDLVPKDFKGKPANCLVAIQWGAEVGLKPMQALQNIAVINGRPSLWGDALIALVRASPACEYVREFEEGSAAVCVTKRRGDAHEHVFRFGDEDARKAGLIGKAGPWSQYPKRMKQMRARAFLLRDVYPDVLKGLAVAEEVMDYPEALSTTTPKEIASAAASKGADSPERDALLKRLNAAVPGGLQAVTTIWRELSPSQRKLISRDDWADVKSRAEEAERSTQDNKPDTSAPSYAELAERAASLTSLDDAQQLLSDCSHLPDDERHEIVSACEDWMHANG